MAAIKFFHLCWFSLKGEFPWTLVYDPVFSIPRFSKISKHKHLLEYDNARIPENLTRGGDILHTTSRTNYY